MGQGEGGCGVVSGSFVNFWWENLYPFPQLKALSSFLVAAPKREITATEAEIK